jgi:MacB-like periplasmic core domain
MPVPVFLAFKEQNHAFEDMIGRAYLDVRYRAGGRTEQFQGMWITSNTFEFLGIQPLLGRPITPEDAKPGSAPVFAMSYALWTKLFNRDAGVLGKALTLNDTPRTLVAIMPLRFQFGGGDVRMPLDVQKNTVITGFGIQPNEVHAVGRLKSGVSLQTASADLQAIAKQFEREYPAWFRTNFKVIASSLTDDYVGEFEGTVWAMMGAVCLLFLIACSNVAHLLLAPCDGARKRNGHPNFGGCYAGMTCTPIAGRKRSTRQNPKCTFLTP